MIFCVCLCVCARVCVHVFACVCVCCMITSICVITSSCAYNAGHWGVLIYQSVSDLNVTMVQPRDMNIMGKITFTWSKFFVARFAHVLSNCSTALTQGRLTWRHNSVLRSIIDLIQPHLKVGMSLFSDMPGYQAPHGGTIPPHILVTALKPDICVISSSSQEVIVFELTCPWDTNIARSHDYKSEKYAPLISDLSQRYIVSFFPVEVSARGQVTKDNRSRLKSFLLKCCNNPGSIAKSVIRVSSKAALLSSYSIFSARKEPTWEDPPPLVVR